MTPVNFNEVNARYGAPEGYAESQVMTIPGCKTVFSGGSMDGNDCVVVAWLPTGLPAHYLSTSFYEATHPA